MKPKKRAMFGCLLLMLVLSGCFLIMGTRANIEKETAFLAEIYPTKNANDLREKFPNGFHLVHKRRMDNMTYLVTLESKSSSSEMTGKFTVERYNRETSGSDLVLEVDLEVDQSGKLHPKTELPEDYRQTLDQFSFLFERLDLSKDKLSTFDYKEHSRTAKGNYSITYTEKADRLSLDINSKDGEVPIVFHGQFKADSENMVEEGVTVGTGLDYIFETFKSEGGLKAK